MNTVYRNVSRGLTLVETVVLLAIFTVIMLVVTESIASFYRIHAYTIAQAYQVSHARRGVEQLVQDIREMTYADDGAFPLVIMDDYRIGFFSDIDRDESVEYIEYELSTSTLEKRVYGAIGNPPVYSTTTEQRYTLSEYVQNETYGTPIFEYIDIYGQQATSTSTVADVKYVRVNIIVNIDPIRDPGEYMLRSSAALRNLKYTF
jgi:hypothetical protein